MTTLERIRRALIRRAFRARFYGDALEAMALHPRLCRMFSRRLLDAIRPGLLDRPTLFIHVPKNAGTSIARALYPSQLGHLSMRHYLLACRTRRLPPTFAVLRDPIERFLSAYDFFRAGGGAEVKVYRAVMDDIGGIDTIDDYLDYLERARGNWLKVDNPARPQWWFLVDAKRRVAVDELFIMGTGMIEVAERVARSGGGPIPHHNRTSRKTFTLSQEQRRRVERLYGADIALYEYVGRHRHDPGAARGRTIGELTRGVVGAGGGRANAQDYRKFVGR